MATYVNDLRLKEIATGDESGTWGTSTNTNLELIANAMGVGAEAVANASTHTITMADGTADEFRSTFLRLTGGGQACTVTLAPNTLSHTWIMRNETAAALTLTQGSGANVVIAAGQTKIVATDGAGSGAVVYEMDDLELAGNLAVDGAITSSSGATITVADNSNNLTLTSTDGDANAGPKLDLYRNSTGPADGDLLGRINFRGRNDNSQDVDYAAWVSRISDASDGSEDGILRADILAAGAVVDVLTLYGTEVVVNESHADVDFRVESDGNTHALFVQGSSSNVGIGTSSPSTKLHLGGTAPGDSIIRQDSTGSGTNWEIGERSAGKWQIFEDDTDSIVATFTSTGNLGIGTSTPSRALATKSSSVTVANFESTSSTAGFISFSDSNTTNDVTVRAGAVGDNLVLQAGGSERLRIDSSGNLLLGTTASGSAGLNVGNSVNIGFSEGANSAIANIFRQSSSAATILASGYKVTSTANKYASSYASSWARTAVACHYGGIRFFADAAATVAVGTDITPTERMRIDESGNFLIGTTSTSDSDVGAKIFNGARMVQGVAGTGLVDMHDFYRGTAGSLSRVGNIRTNGSSTAYNTSSDYRLKENVVAMSGATERLKQLNPSRFNFIADADTTVDGFLAHEVQDVVPEAISGTKDAIDADGNPEYQGIDQSKLVPLLVATIQELEARLTALENN